MSRTAAFVAGEYAPPAWDHMPAPPKHIARLSTTELLDAQFETAKFLEGIGDQPEDALAEETATAVFGTLADTKTPPDTQRDSLRLLRTPDAVKHLVAMLTAYEWQFVEEATKIRGYVVAQLLEESKNSNARIRLQALQMLGKVTEIALFTERMEVRKVDMTDEELEKKVREKLTTLITSDAEDVESIEMS